MLSNRPPSIRALAEMINGTKGTISPLTRPLFEFYHQTLSYDEPEVDSDAAFAVGVLGEQSTVDLAPQNLA